MQASLLQCAAATSPFLFFSIGSLYMDWTLLLPTPLFFFLYSSNLDTVCASISRLHAVAAGSAGVWSVCIVFSSVWRFVGLAAELY